MKEQRNFHRLSTPGKVVFEDKNIPDSAVINISYGGVAIYSREKLDVGKHLSFELKVELLYDSLKCSGVIRHVTGKDSFGLEVYKMGIEFVNVNKDSVVFIIKRIQSVFSEQRRKNTGIKPPDFIPY